MNHASFVNIFSISSPIIDRVIELGHNTAHSASASASASSTSISKYYHSSAHDSLISSESECMAKAKGWKLKLKGVF